MKMISLLVLGKKLEFLMNSLQNNAQFQVVAKLPSVFISKTDKHLSTITFYENEIKKLFVILILTKLMGMTCLVFAC